MMLRRRIVSFVLLSFALVVFAPPAVASCGEIPPTRYAIQEARTVFVGTVVEAENARRWVQVDVHDVWKGEASERVEVRAGPADPPGEMMAASSVDRTYKLGETYLFVLWNKGTPFQDNACSATTPWGPRLAQYDPTPDGPEPGRGAPFIGVFT